MPELIEIKPLQRYRLWLRYEDGVEGEVDLSNLAGDGVFEKWLEPGAFEAVTLDENGAPAWPGDIDLCPGALYLRLIGKRPEDVLPGLQDRTHNA